MEKLYTAVGCLQFQGRRSGKRYPLVKLNGKEYLLDMQEMMLWSILNWRIVSMDELCALYVQKEKESGYFPDRGLEECLRRLLQRGLAADGSGESGADALYRLLSELYIVPIPESPLLRAVSFIRLTVFGGVPVSAAKRVFGKDRRDDGEKKVIRLANRALLSTSEIIKCIEQKVFDFSSEDELAQILFHDDYTTGETIAEEAISSPECRPILTAVANLYLRRQIIFERV